MKYANKIGYSDITPFEVVNVISEKTMEVREMQATIDPTWKPEFHVGGFSAHCSNQNEQRWTYESIEDRQVIRIRLRKDGKWYSKQGRHVLADEPRKFYDYNF